MGFHSKTGPRVTTRGTEPELRRARLLAARTYPAGGIARRGILSGQWDGGEVVRGFLAPPAKTRGAGR
jgi:hypothetical protein